MQTMTETLQKLIGKPLVESTDQEIYLALLDLVRSKSAAQVRPVNGRKLYYISAEFLIGKLLSNNLINLGLYDDVRDAPAAAGKSLSDIEEVEPEPSLGNGGFGPFGCLLPGFSGNAEPAGRRHRPALPLWPVPPELCRRLAERTAGPLAERTFLGGKRPISPTPSPWQANLTLPGCTNWP